MIDVIFDASYGSSGKGKLSPFMAHVRAKRSNPYSAYSVSNYPNAGHTFCDLNGRKVVVKVLPSASMNDRFTPVLISPGSGFSILRLYVEWMMCRPSRIIVHERAQVITRAHKEREVLSSGARSIASTMQGTGIAIADKIGRGENGIASMFGSNSLAGYSMQLSSEIEALDENEKSAIIEELQRAQCAPHQFGSASSISLFLSAIEQLSAQDFRNAVNKFSDERGVLHEVSQGWALSIDHGVCYPFTTSRNCGVGAALDQLGVSPRKLGRVVANVRSYPIRVGNFYENDANGNPVLVGSSGPWTAGSQEISWARIAEMSGMPKEEADALEAREKTTVTKRVRRVATLDIEQVADACRSNGATDISLNFVQYLNWNDSGIRGKMSRVFGSLSVETRAMVASLERATGIPVSFIGTGAAHELMIAEDYPESA